MGEERVRPEPWAAPTVWGPNLRDAAFGRQGRVGRDGVSAQIFWL
jgi:hypothetical protein